MQISAVVLTKNSAISLEKCLSSLGWCDEIIVVDDNSTDQTRSIAVTHQAKFFTHSLSGNFATQRNFALTKTQNDWALFVDSDEVVTPKLKQEIKKLDFKANGYYLPRTDIFLKQKLNHGETAQIKLLRLGNKNFGHWVRPVHEIWKIKGITKTLRNPLHHERNLSISDFITRLNTYTSIEKMPFKWFDLFKPMFKFFVNYIFHAGYLDKMPGFIVAYMMSLNSLITRVKSWEKKYL